MESELYEAAVKGNVPSLLELLEKDKLLLDRIMIGNHIETPLHIAAMLGHLKFVEEVLARKAKLAREQDSQRSTPLHLAAAKGYFYIVASLLRVDPEICFVRDKYERNPLHVAAMKGHVDVLDLLLRTRPDAARSVVENGQTILHLCVKHNRLETLNLLIDILGNDQFINSTDEYGDTILHLAAADRQTKTVLFLVNKGVNPNITNSRGFTALGLLAQRESSGRASEIKGYDSQTSESHDPSGRPVCANPTVAASHPPVGKEDERERKIKRYSKMQQTLLVVATLLATLAFEAIITPPSGLWQDDYTGKKVEDKPNHTAGESILADKYPHHFHRFIKCNTGSFIASLIVIMLIISGLPPKWSRITTWIAMLTTWVAVTFTAATYALSVYAFTPNDQYSIITAVSKMVLAWVGLMALLFLCYLVRFIVMLVPKVRKFVRKSSTKWKAEGLMA